MSLTLPATPQKLEDFGAKIAGARKDLHHAAAASNHPTETLATLFPEADYQAAVAAGITVETLAAVKAIRDSLPGKPTLHYRLKGWHYQVAQAREACAALLAGTATGQEVLRCWPGAALRSFALYLQLGYPLFLSARGWRVATGTIAHKPATFAVFRDKLVASAEGRGEEAETEMVNYIREQIQCGQAKPSLLIAFSVFTNRQTGAICIGRKAGGEVIPLKTGFTTVAAAFDYLQTNRAELEAAWSALKAPACRRETNEARRGPARRAGDATPEDFLQKFGFRGVQFGNWVEADRRRRDLNDAHDALMDLAAALGLPVAALGFGGRLGLAFGARGKGKAMAHYEPTHTVINLTKTNGPGCLAHEWFHSLDNLSQTKPGGHATVNSAGAFRDLARVLSTGTFATRSRSLDAVRGKRYYGKIEELAARAFEKYVTDRLAAAGAANDYLANLALDSAAYPTAEEMANGITRAFDSLFASLGCAAAGLYLF